ncbi:MAG: nucleotidyltransferase family protein [Desulfobacterales bacterium]|nr:MAG: nucleotidyltransferase family protein [Desulfobacterales bacterium]
MEAIILAGGKGKRLRKAVSQLPKPMANINGKPFLEYLLAYLRNFDFARVILAVGYMGEKIRDYFGPEYRGLPLQYSFDDIVLGTGGALKKALAEVQQPCAFAINGDTFFEVNFQDIFSRHMESGADVTVAVRKERHSERFGTVRLEHRKIVGFEEKKCGGGGYINAGVYLVNKSLLNLFPPQACFSFEAEFLETAVDRVALEAFVSEGYFIDIGTPADYEMAKNEFRRVFK